MIALQLRCRQLAMFLLYFDFVCNQLVQTEEQETDPKFPSVWNDGQNGEGNEQADVYRIKAEIDLLGSGKSFVIEEWASGIEEKFRLDMIEAAVGKRSTYLSHKITDESFYYEPFRCELVENFNNSMDRELADKLQPPEMSRQLVPIGVGALWIHALRLRATYRKPPEDCGLVGAVKSRIENVCFESYTVNATREYQYDLTFYFRMNKIGSGPGSLVSIVVSKQSIDTKSEESLMRIKILQMESSFGTSPEELNDLFELPLGYGCQRRDAGIVMALGQPVDVYGAIAEPKVLRLDVVAQLPVDNGNDAAPKEMHQWGSHSTSLRLVVGTITLDLGAQRDYLAFEKRELVPDKRLAGRRPTLRRSRQVWDLGQGGLLDDGEAARPGDQGRRKILYELDDQLEKCLDIGESQLSPGIGLGFYGSGSSGSERVVQFDDNDPKVTSVWVNISLLKLLFGPPDGYHQVRKLASSNRAYYNEIYFEKRLESFEMLDSGGQLVWSGPVSLVRKELKPRGSMFRAGAWQNELPQTSVTIHFLNKQLDQLVGKVNLALNEGATINQASFHRELSVRPCFSGGDQLEFKIDYPLGESADAIACRLAHCAQCRTMLEKQFLMSLYNISGGRLDPLQVDDVSLEMVGSDSFRASARLMTRPNLVNYQREPATRFSSLRKSLLFSELQPDESGCADTCSHYNCSAFAYCAKTSQCDLFMGETELLPKVGTERAAGCSLLRSREILDGVRLVRAPEPAQLVQQMREAMAKSSELHKNPLEFSVHHCTRGHDDEFHQLIPSSIVTARQVGSGGASVEDADGHLLLRAEYELVLENRRFGPTDGHAQLPASLFPIPQAKFMDYEECRRLCDQTACKSFSHCQLEKTCLISQLHDTGMIREHSVRDDYCFVFARDWLSKFSQPVRVYPNSRDGKSLDIVANKSLQVAESRDCASRCMDEISFKCKSFYLCQQDNSQAPNCYLSRRYPRVDEFFHRSSPNTSNPGAQTTECQLYTRSRLVDFVKFHGKSLPEVGVDAESGSGRSFVVKPALGAEACALECAERTGNCQAFQVCRPEGGSGALEPSCVMLIGPDESDWLGPEKLLAHEKCTSFVVAEESELRHKSVGDKSFDENYDGSSSSTGDGRGNTSNWLLVDVVLLLAGLAIGHGLALVLRRRRRH